MLLIAPAPVHCFLDILTTSIQLGDLSARKPRMGLDILKLNQDSMRQAFIYDIPIR